MSILDDCADLMPSTATIKGRVQIYDNATGQVGGYTETTKKSGVVCAYYEGASAIKLLGEKLRPDIKGLFVFNPKDFEGITIDEEDIIELSGGGTFQVANSDNVQQMDEVWQVAVKEVR
jgi:hypothetical protein